MPATTELAGTIPATAKPSDVPAPQLFRLPGVYRPQHDTALLVDTIRSLKLRTGAVALDICTGTGALAIAAVRAGASQVLAVDISRGALLNTWLNARLRRMPIQTARIGVEELRRCGSYDLVLANPPYVPSARGGRRCWDGGPTGRSLLEPLCEALPSLLRAGGTALLVQSEVAGIDRTVETLAASGLSPVVVRTHRIPYGPVMQSRSWYFESHRMMPAGANMETIAVIGARRTG
jgi:release factor glutamine methyltransferase